MNGGAAGADDGARAIRIVIVDDHALIRRGLRRLLTSEGFEVVGDGADLAEARRLVAETLPDVVGLDLHLAEGSSLPGIPELLRIAPQTRVVVLSMQDGPAFVRAALAAGAVAYVLKDTSAELGEAIRDAWRGGPDRPVVPAAQRRPSSTSTTSWSSASLP